MTDTSLDFEVVIDAPAHTVFELCRDPRRIYAGDPTHEVTQAALAPEGVGTTARVVATAGPFHEDITLQYVEQVPEERIVFDAYPRTTLRGLRRWEIPSARHTWTWTFAPSDAGTRLHVAVLEHDAPLWERTFDTLLRHAPTRMFRKEIDARLARIKAAAEKQAASAG
jgi:uncharacterized protein YndB with AHSA1/START domain